MTEAVRFDLKFRVTHLLRRISDFATMSRRKTPCRGSKTLAMIKNNHFKIMFFDVPVLDDEFILCTF